MTEDRSRQRLGRGLASLIGGDRGAAAPRPGFAPAPPLPPQGERSVPTATLVPNPRNPRRHFDEGDLAGLSASIRTHGVVQPILVRPKDGEEGRFEIVAGERRWRAAQAAGLREVPVVVRPIGDRESLEIAIIENVQRSDLNAIEEAEAYRMLTEEHGYTQSDLADALGKSRSHVANTLRLLKLPSSVQRMVMGGELSAGHARTAISVKNPEGFARRVAERGLTVREAEKLARKDLGVERPKNDSGAKRNPQDRASAPVPSAAGDADTAALEALLSDALGMPVAIDLPSNGGSLHVAYGTLERLDELCRLLQMAGEHPGGPRIREL